MTARKWEISQRDLREPPALTGNPTPEDRRKNNDAFTAWGLATERHLMERSGIAPDRSVTAELLAVTTGPLLGLLKSAAARIADLEKRLDEVEANGVRYCGTHQRALAYRKGSVVSYAGSGWVALRDVPEGVQPGEDHQSWQLMVKRGSDAGPQREKKEQGR